MPCTTASLTESQGFAILMRSPVFSSLFEDVCLVALKRSRSVDLVEQQQCLFSALSYVAYLKNVCTVSQWMLKEYVLHRSTFLFSSGEVAFMSIFVISISAQRPWFETERS